MASRTRRRPPTHRRMSPPRAAPFTSADDQYMQRALALARFSGYVPDAVLPALRLMQQQYVALRDRLAEMSEHSRQEMNGAFARRCR